MSNRRLFLRNALLGLAASLVPRILQPVVPEVVVKPIDSISMWDKIIPIVDEYQLATFKIQAIISRQVPVGRRIAMEILEESYERKRQLENDLRQIIS